MLPWITLCGFKKPQDLKKPFKYTLRGYSAKQVSAKFTLYHTDLSCLYHHFGQQICFLM